MRGVLPTVIAIAFQIAYFGLLRSVFFGVGASVEAAESVAVRRLIGNGFVPRGAWHEIVKRQETSGNRTQDLADFFLSSDPPSAVRLLWFTFGGTRGTDWFILNCYLCI